MGEISAEEVARRSGVSSATLRRWVKEGLVPLRDGQWTEGAAAQARAVARLRERGYSLAEIGHAAKEGRLAFAYLEALLPERPHAATLAEASEETGLDPDLIRRIVGATGFPQPRDTFSRADLDFLRLARGVLDTDFPLTAFLQVLGVYGRALSQVADVEVRMLGMFVHEPMIKEGTPGLEIAENLQDLADRVYKYTGPLLDYLHDRFVEHYVSQDVVTRSESELSADTTRLDRVLVMIGFVDLAGFTRFTEKRGETEAIDLVERFVGSVRDTLPAGAHIVKGIGDEVMLVSTDPVSLTDWAVGFQELNPGRPRPRIGLHYGIVIYREADYFGTNVNLAARVTSRAMAGEILVTEPVVRAVEGANPNLEFRSIGDVRLKGFEEPVALMQVKPAE